ncbi:MAG: hypothetical protein ACTSVF_05495 [Candidatus Asgardarchaeia archaeon]
MEIRENTFTSERNLKRKKRLDLVEWIGFREERIVNYQLYVTASHRCMGYVYCAFRSLLYLKPHL